MGALRAPTAHRITREWRMTIVKQLSQLGMTQTDLASAVSTSPATINRILIGATWSSPLVPAIESVLRLGGDVVTPPASAAEDSADPLANIAELREAQDAIEADIAQHEKVRDVVADRLAESYRRRSEITAEIRRLRGDALRGDSNDG